MGIVGVIGNKTRPRLNVTAATIHFSIPVISEECTRRAAGHPRDIAFYNSLPER